MGGLIIICPKCSSEKCVKDDITKEKQRYRCKFCNFKHTVQYRGKSPDVKRQALELYLEVLGFRSIGRFLKCSYVSVYNWIKSFGEAVKDLRSDSTIEVVEMDEMHRYVSLKKTTTGYGLLLINIKKRFVNCVLNARDMDNYRQTIMARPPPHFMVSEILSSLLRAC
jgi:transposase-like protein